LDQAVHLLSIVSSAIVTLNTTKPVAPVTMTRMRSPSFSECRGWDI